MVRRTAPIETVIRRIEARCIPVPFSGCWLWEGATGGGDDAYGKIVSAGKQRYTHILMYEHVNGPIPPGKELDHLCRVPLCCNPAHLEAVTHSVNQKRALMPNRAKTHCLNGHPFAGDNLIVTKLGRQCRACAIRRKQEHYARNRTAILQQQKEQRRQQREERQ